MKGYESPLFDAILSKFIPTFNPRILFSEIHPNVTAPSSEVDAYGHGVHADLVLFTPRI